MAVVVNSEIYKQIDRINKRLEQATKADELLEVNLLRSQYDAVLRAAIPAEYIRQGKYGLIISKSKAAQEALKPEMLERLEALPTAGEFKQDVMQNAAEETGKDIEDVTIEDMKDYADDIQTVKDAEDKYHKIKYTDDDAATMTAEGTKSYAELAKIVRNYEKSLKEEKQQKEKRRKVSSYDKQHATGTAKARRSTSAGDRVRGGGNKA